MGTQGYQSGALAEHTAIQTGLLDKVDPVELEPLLVDIVEDQIASGEK